mmetsp:Transcript_1521/g.4185  ORF Transcript_1521/g.4185 Transcript_1521/m.4185 type:complete len:236 (+) Transcript_1521:582-1289(+)
MAARRRRLHGRLPHAPRAEVLVPPGAREEDRHKRRVHDRDVRLPGAEAPLLAGALLPPACGSLHGDDLPDRVRAAPGPPLREHHPGRLLREALGADREVQDCVLLLLLPRGARHDGRGHPGPRGVQRREGAPAGDGRLLPGAGRLPGLLRDPGADRQDRHRHSGQEVRLAVRPRLQQAGVARAEEVPGGALREVQGGLRGGGRDQEDVQGTRVGEEVPGVRAEVLRRDHGLEAED